MAVDLEPERVAARADGTSPRSLGLVVLGGAVVGFGALLLRPPVHGAYPVCPWLALTGADCPLCGGMRATESLLRGDVAGAADFNLLVTIALPLLLLGAVVAAVLGRRAQPLVAAGFAKPTVIAVAAVTAGFFLLRLLPVAPWLSSTA